MVSLRQRVGRFRKDTSGSASLEFMIWIPLVFGITVTLLDFSHAMTVNSTMWHEARVAARGLSMHAMSDEAARSEIVESLSWTGADYIVDIQRDNRRVTVEIRTPMKTSGLVDFATARLTGDWVARVAVLQEPV